MAGHEQIDRLFLTRAQDMRLLSRAQVLEVYHELGMRRYREADLQAYEVVVEKGWLGPDVAMSLLEAAPEESADAKQARLGSSPNLAPSENEIPELTDSELSIETEHDNFAGSTDPGIGTQTVGDAEEYDYSQVPKLVEPLSPSYAVADGGSSEDSVLEMELPPPESSSGDSLFEEPDSQPPVPSLEADDLPEIVSERTPSVVYDPGSVDQILDSSDTLDEINALEEPEIQVQDDRSPVITARDWSGPGPGSETEKVKKGKGKTRTRKQGKGKSGRNTTARKPAPGETAGHPTHDFSGRSVSRTAGDTAAGDTALPAAAMFEVKGAKGADIDFASFGEDGDLPQSELIDESEDISVAMVDSAVSDVMDDADDAYFGAPADLTRTPAEVLEDSIAPPAPLHGTTLFDSEALANESDIVIADDESDFSATSPPIETSTESLSELAKDDSDIDFGETLAGEAAEKQPVSGVDAADIGLTDVTDEATSVIPGQLITTTSKTQFATGEMAQPGLGRSKSKVGVESNITAEEITLADLRQQMGIGAGVKLGAEGQGALSRLRKVGGLKKRYSVIREIARGGMGKVIEVEDNDLRRSVALKVLRKEMLERKDLVQRFLEEAQITGQLEHPNIVPVHEIGVDGRGNLYFTMKLVEGEDLSSILKRMRKKDPSALKAYPISRMIDVFIKACEGIAYAHSKGVIHRDLKPANIMVGRYGEVQIMDWGVAKIIGRKEDTNARMVASDRQEDDANRTMAGSLLGTPSYMSPEQARGEVNNMGPTSDIFSLGVILYELLALKTPWTAQTSAAVLDQVKSFSPEPPGKMAPDRKIPPELEQLAMKCIEKRADKRLQSVQDLIENLRSWQEGRTLAAVQYTIGQLMTKWIGRHKVALAAGFAILLALVGGVLVATNIARNAAENDARSIVASAKQAHKKAQGHYDVEEYDNAISVADKALAELNQAIKVLGNEGEQKAVENELTTVLGIAKIKKLAEEENRIKKLQDAARDKELKEALENARELRRQADLLYEDTSAKRADVREKFSEAQGAFSIVQGIERENAEAQIALNEIGAKLIGIDNEVRQQAALEILRGLVEQAGESVKVAVAMGRTPANYDGAAAALITAIRLCDSAIYAEASGESAEKLKDAVLELKAQATLDYARRALELNKFDVCYLMLEMARSTTKYADDEQVLRKAYVEQEAKESTYGRYKSEAKALLDARKWAEAQPLLQSAIQETFNNPSEERDKDRPGLQAELERARVEQVNDDAVAAIAARKSPSMLRVIKQYDDLLEGENPLNVDAQKLNATSGRDTLQVAAIAALLSEANDKGVEIRVKESLLRDAQELARKRKDAGADATISKQLRDVRQEIAGTRTTERDILLDRGTYNVGSSRESDQNPRHEADYQDKFVFFDRFLVTNKDFKQNFVDKGGYENPGYWDRAAVPLMARFVDSTGKKGPAGWANGTYDPSQAQYPVTGLSWYEAAAYCRVVGEGRRLPTPDEWEIAAGAPTTERGVINEYGFERSKLTGMVSEPREVGTTSWDTGPRGVRDLGNNVAEWTSEVVEGKAKVKGAEPGIRAELFDRYARRTKNSFADPAERSLGRGFRCARDLTIETKD